MHREDGFTLIELLTGMIITTMLLGLAVLPLRHYWFAQSINAATDEVVTRLRAQQEDAVSEAHPLIFGARFVPGAMDYTLYRYDPNAVGGTCSSELRRFDSGVFNAAVRVKTVTVTNDPNLAEHQACRSDLSDQIIFFYARGTSTGGSIVLEQPNSGREETITVSVATGRIERS